MLHFLLAGLLLSIPLQDEGTSESEKSTETVQYRSSTYPIVSHPELRRGALWMDFGYGQVDSYFDQDGSVTELGELAPGVASKAQVQSFVLNIGGAYSALRTNGFDIVVGANLGLVQRRFTMEAVPEAGLPATNLSSGLSPQLVTFFVEGRTEAVALRTGFILDVGTEDDVDTIHNSDGQNAFLLGVSAQQQVGLLRLFGGLTYVLRLEGTLDDFGEVEFDQGDVFAATVGTAYSLGPVGVGASLIFRHTTEGHVGGMDGSQISTDAGFPNDFGATNAFSIAPFVTYEPAGQAFSLYLKGAVQREYIEYGYTFAGENDIAPRFGFTLGAVYNL